MTTGERDMLDQLLEKQAGLSGWEMDFIEDLDEKDDASIDGGGGGYQLSDRQRTKLLQIWEAACG